MYKHNIHYVFLKNRTLNFLVTVYSAVAHKYILIRKRVSTVNVKYDKNSADKHKIICTQRGSAGCCESGTVAGWTDTYYIRNYCVCL